MTCYKCGFEIPPFAIACPRCAEKSKASGTRRLPDLSDTHTKHLVQLEQCASCRWLLFPGDTVCPSCGTPVKRPDQQAPAVARPADADYTYWIRLALGVTGSLIVIGLLIFLVRLLRNG